MIGVLTVIGFVAGLLVCSAVFWVLSKKDEWDV
jgi:hypothetical protein